MRSRAVLYHASVFLAALAVTSGGCARSGGSRPAASAPAPFASTEQLSKVASLATPQVAGQSETSDALDVASPSDRSGAGETRRAEAPRSQPAGAPPPAVSTVSFGDPVKVAAIDPVPVAATEPSAVQRSVVEDCSTLPEPPGPAGRERKAAAGRREGESVDPDEGNDQERRRSGEAGSNTDSGVDSAAGSEGPEVIPAGPSERSDSIRDALRRDQSAARRRRDRDGGPLSLLDILSPGADKTDEQSVSPEEALLLSEVVLSVRNYFPMLQSAYLERQRTAGDQLAAWGEFDTKAKAYTENQPLGFYENYQHGAGLVQPRYRGGEFFSGYRIGRGFFEPWYQERQTNDGGEFKVGFDIPLVRDHEIDQRRADLWRATYDRQLAEPDIRQQMIAFVFDATVAYWTWVAAGQQYRIGDAALDLADRRNRQIERRVEEGDLGKPALADNERAIAQRRAKLLDRERKLRQAAVKLSLFVREGDTRPVIPEDEWLPPMPKVTPYDRDQLAADIQTAILQRPELVALDTLYRRTRVDLAEAINETLPVLDAVVNASQDVGRRTSSKGDKSELELEAGLVFEMPLQQRKGRGKAQSARAKLRQLEIKRQFTVEKIATEVQAAAAALEAAYGRVQQTLQAVKLAEQLAQIEQRKFELGESDLLSVFFREQFAIEAADELVLTRLDYFVALAEYQAALAYTFPNAPLPQEVVDSQ